MWVRCLFWRIWPLGHLEGSLSTQGQPSGALEDEPWFGPRCFCNLCSSFEGFTVPADSPSCCLCVSQCGPQARATPLLNSCPTLAKIISLWLPRAFTPSFDDSYFSTFAVLDPPLGAEQQRWTKQESLPNAFALAWEDTMSLYIEKMVIVSPKSQEETVQWF